MTHYAAQSQLNRSFDRPMRATRVSVGRIVMIATALVIEAALILVVVLSSVGAGSEGTPTPGPRLPAPSGWTR